MTRIFFAFLVLYYSMTAFAETHYMCAHNENYPGMVGVFKEGMLDFILLEAKDKGLSFKELSKISITKKNDDDDNGNLACFFGENRGIYSEGDEPGYLLKEFRDHKLKKKFLIHPLKSKYTSCNGIQNLDEYEVIQARQNSKIFKLEGLDILDPKNSKKVFSFVGSTLSFCGLSGTDPD